MKRLCVIGIFLTLFLAQCREPETYPDEPVIRYESFVLYVQQNNLGVETLIGEVNFSFTDGDGNVGMEPISDTAAIGLPDTVQYNLFMQLYDYQDSAFIPIPEEEGGYLKYIIPFLDKQPLSGTISVTLEYPLIRYDTIFYTFYMVDRDYNRSNTDTTDTRILSGIELNSEPE